MINVRPPDTTGEQVCRICRNAASRLDLEAIFSMTFHRFNDEQHVLSPIETFTAYLVPDRNIYSMSCHRCPTVFGLLGFCFVAFSPFSSLICRARLLRCTAHAIPINETSVPALMSTGAAICLGYSDTLLGMP